MEGLSGIVLTISLLRNVWDLWPSARLSKRLGNDRMLIASSRKDPKGYETIGMRKSVKPGLVASKIDMKFRVHDTKATLVSTPHAGLLCNLWNAGPVLPDFPNPKTSQA